jgi:hypothetical protein
MDIKEEIKKLIEKSEEAEKEFTSDKRYANAIYSQGEQHGYTKVLRLIEEIEAVNGFSWVDVNLGDEVVDKYDRNGKVTGLIFAENGFTGMEVLYDGYSIPNYYKGDGYKTFKRIGKWVNEKFQ